MARFRLAMKKSSMALAALLATATAASGLSAAVLAQEREGPARQPAQAAAARPTPPTPPQREAIATARELGDAFATVAERVSPSVVSVRVQARMPSGSG